MGVRWSLLIGLVLSGCELTDLDGDGVAAADDCNDQDPSQLRPVDLFVDADGDGFGGPVHQQGCTGNAWLVDNDLDCDDKDPDIHPSAIEIGCDGRDNDCSADTPDGPAVTVGSTWGSVQEALDAAGYHETVQLCASIIHERLVIREPVTLVGAGAERTILDATGLGGPVVEVAAQATLRSLTLTGGSGRVLVDDPDDPDDDARAGLRAGGAVLVTDGDLLVVEDSTVRGNEADLGGAIAALGSGPVFVWASTLSSNRAELGGALYVDGPVSVEVWDSMLIDNDAVIGGGAWISGVLSLVDSRVEKNTADLGGGIHLHQPPFGFTDVFATGSTLYANTADLGGGASGTGHLYELAFEGNTAGTGGGAYGVGSLGIIGSEMIDNHADDGSGGAVASAPDTYVEVSGSTLLSNTATEDGGALYLPDSDFDVIDVRIEDNHARRGGGLFTSGPVCGICDRTVLQSELRFNEATESGGGLYLECAATLSMQADVLDGNAAPSGSAAFVSDAHLALITTDVIGHTEGDDGAVRLQRGTCPQPVTRTSSVGGLFAGNAPADLSVGDLGEVDAPPGNFECLIDGTVETCL